MLSHRGLKQKISSYYIENTTINKDSHAGE
jgi:hypothetical protein